MLMKKDFLNLRRSRWLLLSLFALFVGVSPAGAEEITVHDGTESSYSVPLFGYRNDSYVKMEYVLPASELADMSGGTITGLKYYLKSSESSSYGNANFVVFLKEVNATTVTAFTGYTTEDIVYQGALDATGATLDIPFNKNYSYNGGNLLVGIYNTVKGTAGEWQVAYYYGTTATSGASAYSYSSQSMASASYVYKQSFLPKTTFTYTAPSCKPVKNLNSSNITADAADISWTAGDGVQTQWQIVYSTDVNFDKDAATPIDVNTTSYKLEGLESGTTYYVAVRSYYSAEEQSNWVSTSFKTEKVAVPAVGFVDDFESNKGWDLINGSCPNKWVRGTSTNNGGNYSLYVSSDGTTYPTSSYGSYSLVYAVKLFHFEAGDYTISYDWKCNGEGNYDFLRVGLVPASLELSASTSYSNLGSGSTLPTGWTMFLDGGSKLGGSTVWANKSVDFNIAEAGNYQVVFAWRNDGSSGNSPAAIDNLRIIGSAPVIEVGGDVAGTTLAFGTVNEATNKTITITNVGKVAMNNISLSETADADNVFAYTALPKTSLDVNESMDVTVTFSGSSAKEYTGTFRVAADDCDPVDVTVTATYSNTPATMAITLDEVAVDETVAFGTVGKQATKTFKVANDGDQTLNITSIASNNTTDFTVSPANLTVAGHSNETFTVTFVYPNESPVLDVEKTATITVTASNDGVSAKNFTVTGTRIELWSEDFEANAKPSGWDAEDYWTFSDGVAHSAYHYSYNKTKALTTPSLKVESNTDVLYFKAKSTGTYVQVKIKYSKDGGDFTDLKTIDLENNMAAFETYEITGLEAGNYQFQFMNDDYDLDDFEGFKLITVDHDVRIAEQSIPTTGSQYVEYTASITVKEVIGKDENLTAKFFIGAEQFGTDVVETVEANGTKTFTVTFTPDAAVSGNAHFTVTNGDINLTSDNVAVIISKALVLDEAADNSELITEGTKPAVVVNYSKAVGKWGTIALPFQTTTEELSLLYGTTVKAFTFAANDGGNLKFNTATTLLAGYPYVIYSDGAMSGEMKFFNKAVTTTAHYDEYDGVTFQTIYAPKSYTGGDSWYGITPAGEIRPAGEGASVKALRGYLQATAGARLSIFIEDLATGITTVLSPKEFEAEGAYNLQGQKVQQAKKGLYIVNGRKVVVR